MAIVTLKNIIDDTRRISESLGDVKKTNVIEERQIIFWANDYRSIAIQEQFGSKKTLYPKVDQQLIQDMGCVFLECVDKAECCGVKWGCKIMKATIPNYINLPGDAGLNFVGLIDKQQRFTKIEAYEVKDKLAQKFAKTQNYFYLIGNDLYIVSPANPELEWVNVRLVPYDPRDVCVTDCDKKTCCYDFEKDSYPLLNGMARYIVTNILTERLGIALKFVQTEVKNAFDE